MAYKSKSSQKFLAGALSAAVVTSVVAPGVAAAAGFSDVQKSDYYYEAVMALSSKGIINGVGDGKFAPQDPVKREAFAKILAGVMNYDVDNIKDPEFSDVKAGEWYYKYVAALKEYGITNGIGDGKFGVGQNLSRGQAAKFIVEAFDLKPVEGKDVPFKDIKGSVYENAIKTLYTNGYINGISETQFAPDASITRGALAAMIYRVDQGETITKDTEAPKIELVGDATVEVENGATYTDAGVKVTDNVDKDLQANVEIKDEKGTVVEKIDTTKAGKYTITYTAKDAAGNEAEAVVRTVVVKEAATPAVESVKAINGAQLEVKFNKAIDASTVIDATNNTLKNGVLTVSKVDGNGSVTVDDTSLATLSEDGKTLTVTAKTGGAFNDLKYVVTVAADTVKTTDGKFVPKFTSNVIESSDTTAPVVANVEKLNASKVRVHFSEPLSNEGSWSFKFADGTLATVDVDNANIAKGYVDLTIDAGVTAGKEITATAIGTKDFAGNLVNPNPVTVKLTKGQLDGTKPTVSSVTALGLNKFEVKFSEEVQGFNGADITIDGGSALKDYTDADAAALEAGEAKVTQDKTDKTKYTVELGTTLAAGIHAVGLPANAVTDLSGEPNEAYSKVLEFKKDETAPKLVSSQVKKDENGFEYLHLTFDESVNAGTVSALKATSVKDYVTTTSTMDLTGITSVPNTDNKEYKVKLADVKFNTAGLTAGANYTLTLTGAFTDTSNNALETSSINFVRGTDALTVAQSVEKVEKVAGTPSAVKVTFKQDVDGSTATNPVNYNINGTVVEKAEIHAGEPKVVYLTLKDGSNTLTGERNVTINGVKTKDGVAMTSAYTGTVSLDENVAPTFTATLVSGDSIKLTFSENVIDATDGITVSDLAVKYNGTALTESGTPQVVGVYKDAAMTETVDQTDSVGTVYIKLATGVITDLSKPLTVSTEGSSVKDAVGNVWATSTVTVK